MTYQNSARLRWEFRRRGYAPQALLPQRVWTGKKGVFQHIDGRAELPPQSGAKRCLHRVFSSHNALLFFLHFSQTTTKAVRSCPQIKRRVSNAETSRRSSGAVLLGRSAMSREFQRITGSASGPPPLLRERGVPNCGWGADAREMRPRCAGVMRFATR